MSAITFVRGRTNQETTESAGITRVAGQFTSPFTACPVRVASTHRARITVGNKFTATQGAVGIYFTPYNNYNGAGQPASGVIWSWYTDGSNYIELLYNKASTRWEISRYASGVGTTRTLPDTTFASGVGRFVYIEWTATTIGLSIAGSAVNSTGDTNIPTLPTTVDIGSRVATANFEARYDAVVFFSAPLTAALITQFNSLVSSRPPACGEFTTLMTGLWYGCHQRVWDMSAAYSIDFLNTDGMTCDTPLGFGMPQPENRIVETPLRDGAAYVDTRLRPRTVTLPITIVDTASVAAFFADRRNLASILSPVNGPGIINFAPGVHVYEVDAIYMQGMMFDDRRSLIQVQSVGFVCPDPAVRSAALVDTISSIAAGGLTIPLTIPMTITAPLTSHSLDNDGEVVTYPTLIYTATVASTGLKLESVTRGKAYTMSGYTIAAGRTVTINMDARTVTLDDGTNLISYRSADSEMWSLAEGTNSIKVSVTSGYGTYTLRYPTRYIGI